MRILHLPPHCKLPPPEFRHRHCIYEGVTGHRESGTAAWLPELGKPREQPRIVSTMELLKKIFQEAQKDRLTAEAAKAAYYFFLSFFPTILALFALTGILGGDAAFTWIMDQLYAALPGEAASYLSRFVLEVTGQDRPGLLSLALLLTLWAASNVFVAIAEGLNVVYDIEEGRSWWKRRVIALAALLASLILLSAATAALVAGPELISLLRLAPVWHVLRWPLAFVLLTAMMWLIYYLLPNREQGRAWRPNLIGALVGSSVWVLGTLGFRLYVANFADYSRTYGFVGGIVVLLLWLYLTAVAILLGGEVAATLEQERARRSNERNSYTES